jgi:hypothetical protein
VTRRARVCMPACALERERSALWEGRRVCGCRKGGLVEFTATPLRDGAAGSRCPAGAPFAPAPAGRRLPQGGAGRNTGRAASVAGTSVAVCPAPAAAPARRNGYTAEVKHTAQTRDAGTHRAAPSAACTNSVQCRDHSLQRMRRAGSKRCQGRHPHSPDGAAHAHTHARTHVRTRARSLSTWPG